MGDPRVTTYILGDAEPPSLETLKCRIILELHRLRLRHLVQVFRSNQANDPDNDYQDAILVSDGRESGWFSPAVLPLLEKLTCNVTPNEFWDAIDSAEILRSVVTQSAYARAKEQINAMNTAQIQETDNVQNDSISSGDHSSGVRHSTSNRTERGIAPDSGLGSSGEWQVDTRGGWGRRRPRS